MPHYTVAALHAIVLVEHGVCDHGFLQCTHQHNRCTIDATSDDQTRLRFGPYSSFSYGVASISERVLSDLMFLSCLTRDITVTQLLAKMPLGCTVSESYLYVCTVSRLPFFTKHDLFLFCTERHMMQADNSA